MRLSEGRREHVTIEGGDPAAAAARFAAEGARVAPPRRPRRGLLRGARRRARRAGRRGGRRRAGAGRRRLPRRARRSSAALDAGAARVLVGTAALTERCDPVGARGALRRAARRRGRRPRRAGRRRRLDDRDRAHRRTSSRGAAPQAGVRAAARDEHPPRRLARRARPRAARRRAGGRACRCSPPAGSPRSTTSAPLRDLGCEGAIVGSALWSGASPCGRRSPTRRRRRSPRLAVPLLRRPSCPTGRARAG